MDQYDIHIEALLSMSPEEIKEEWEQWRGIFRSTGFSPWDGCGCLTTVRRNTVMREAATPDLTERIRADGRIPLDAKDIRPRHYSIFAAWHRIIDKELGRK